MSIKRRPVCKKGERNVLCPHYSDCLDEAVKKSWQYWDCGECRYKSIQESSFEMMRSVNDSVAYYDLPTKIYAKIC